ncbi:MAG: ATP-binding protein [Anaerolineaceae bacterium]|nr:ATP-binding protein [Anaerolineaceae bacterium]
MSPNKNPIIKNEPTLNSIFKDFQTSFKNANPEDKEPLLAQILAWTNQQMDSTTTIDNHGSTLELASLPKSSLTTSSVAKAVVKDFQDLIESETYLFQVAKNIEQVVWLRDNSSGQVLYISPIFKSVWGRSCESLYANPNILIESVHPEDRVQVMAGRDQNNLKPYDQVYRILRPDGSLRWIFARTFMIKNNGDSSFLFCVAQDITDQKQIEIALRKTLNRTREQFKLSHKMSLARKPEVVLRTLMSAHELRNAQRAALLFFDDPKNGPISGVGLTSSWVSRRSATPWMNEVTLYEEPSFWEFFQSNKTVLISTTQSESLLPTSVRDLLVEGQIQTTAIFPLTASGNWLGCLIVHYAEEPNFVHNELRHLKILIDQAAITLFNLKLLEVEAESRNEAERANEIKTEFLAMISHELRTPLTSIIGFTTTLLAKDVNWEPHEQYDFIQTIQEEANRLQELIDHLLDLSRLEAGMLPIVQKPHSIQEIMLDASPQLQSLMDGHKLTVLFPANLPPVFADKTRISQVLVNLVRNSVTYAPKGTEITISASIRGQFAQINVIDQGPGIPLSDHKKVFKAFLRGQQEENVYSKGAGLGLAICKGLVEAHSGRIWIKKKSTPGTTVSFTLHLASLQTLGNPEKRI